MLICQLEGRNHYYTTILSSFLVHFMTLLLSQVVKHQIIGEHELEGMWKEAVMPNIEYYTSIYLEGQGKSTIEGGGEQTQSQ